jgi:hypothetical protein
MWELSVAEQCYQAVLAVISEGETVTDVQPGSGSRKPLMALSSSMTTSLDDIEACVHRTETMMEAAPMSSFLACWLDRAFPSARGTGDP